MRSGAKNENITAVGFEPTPFRTSALSWRLRPLGHAVNEKGKKHQMTSATLEFFINKIDVENLGIDPSASRMLSERSTI